MKVGSRHGLEVWIRSDEDLDVNSAESIKLHCLFRILVVAPDDSFPSAKLLPGKNCLRPAKDSSGQNEKDLLPTPFYNATLQSDCATTNYLSLLHGAAAKCEAFKDACILGRLWLRQRGFAGSIERGGFGHFEWATLMALLLHGEGPSRRSRLRPEYSNHQLFKAMLQFLATRDLVVKPLFARNEAQRTLSVDGPLIFDGETNLNILFKMTRWQYQRVSDMSATLTVCAEILIETSYESMRATH